MIQRTSEEGRGCGPIVVPRHLQEDELMHLLCFIAGFDRLPTPDSILHRLQRVLQGVVPEFPVALEITTGILPEIQGGWLLQAPAAPELRLRVGTYVRADLAVLFYGELFGVEDHLAPHTVADTWSAGGPNAVRDLDGCFSTIVIERTSRRCTVVSDLVGRRTLRYAEVDGSFVVATHDVALVGTGLVRPSVNMTAVRSASAFGWALGGRPFLNGATICEPDSILRYHDRVVTVQREPRLNSPTLPGEGSKNREQEVLTAMMDHLRKLTSSVSGKTGDVKTDLTAGMDTRFVLALLLSTVQKERLVAGTEGQSCDLDVIVAQRIARTVGIRHVIDVHAVPDPAKFLKSLDILAFTVNGDTDAKRAMTDLFQRAEFVDPSPRFYGTASEFFRGACYPMGRSKRQLLGMTYDDVTKWNIKQWTKIDSLPWKDEESRIEVLALLHERQKRYEELCRNPIDLVDLFYVFERFGRWGSFSARATWWAQYFTPFGSTTLIKLGVQLPPPLGFGARLHRAVIRRFLPSCYYTPLVNGAWCVPLLGHPLLASKFGDTVNRLGAIKTRAGRALGGSDQGQAGDQDSWSAKQMGTAIRPAAQSLLSSGRSIAPQVFKSKDIEEMLTGLGSSDLYLTAIATLLTMERWREQVERAWQLAQAEAGPS
jgi:hypothetical protein